MKQIIVIYLLLISNGVAAQTRIVDSLKKIFVQENNPSKKTEHLINYCFYSESLHNDSLLYYSEMLKKMVADEKNIGKTALADFFYALGVYKKGLLDSAAVICDYALQGLNYNNEYNSSFIRLKRLQSNIAIRKQQYQNSLEILFPLQNDIIQKKDTLMQLFNNGAIGLTYMEMGQNEEAIKWFKKNIDFDFYAPYKRYRGILYSNLAAVYNEMNKNDSAEYYIKKSIEINNQYEMLTPQANSYAILSDILTDTKRIQEAELPLLKTIEIRKKINDPYFIVSDMAQLGIFYANNKQTDKGIAICKEGIEIANQYRLNAKLPFLYNALAQNYKAANNKEAYISTLEKIITLKDSLYAKNSEKAIAESKSKYNARELEIKLNESTIAKQKYFTKLLWSIAALVLVVLSAWLVWRKTQKK
jgi:two-component system, NarL family, sensor kinase